VYLDHVTADSRSPATPIAIRITRPYATEDEYLEHDLDTLTRASITLVGAQPRAEGMVLRFEVVLPNGYVLIRGEGRVVGFKANAHQGAGGLSLRFTKLDVRSKALVDKAAALRDQRRPSLRPPPSPSDPPPPTTGPRLSVPPPLRAAASPSRPPAASPSRPPAASRTPPPLPVQAPGAPEPRPSAPPPLPVPRWVAQNAPEAFAPAPVHAEPPAPPRNPTPPPPPLPVAVMSPPAAVASPPAAMPVAVMSPPAADPPMRAAADVDRDLLLARLRERARRLDPAFLANILDRSRWT
jgi:hypothetical protein